MTSLIFPLAAWEKITPGRQIGIWALHRSEVVKVWLAPVAACVIHPAPVRTFKTSLQFMRLMYVQPLSKDLHEWFNFITSQGEPSQADLQYGIWESESALTENEDRMLRFWNEPFFIITFLQIQVFVVGGGGFLLMDE